MRYFVKEIFPLLLTLFGIMAILILWNPEPRQEQAVAQKVGRW